MNFVGNDGESEPWKSFSNFLYVWTTFLARAVSVICIVNNGLMLDCICMTTTCIFCCSWSALSLYFLSLFVSALQEKVYKTICTNWNSNWKQNGPSRITSSLWQPFVSAIVDKSRSVMLVLFCTPSLAVFPTCCTQIDSNLAKFQVTVRAE